MRGDKRARRRARPSGRDVKALSEGSAGLARAARPEHAITGVSTLRAARSPAPTPTRGRCERGCGWPSGARGRGRPAASARRDDRVRPSDVDPGAVAFASAPAASRVRVQSHADRDRRRARRCSGAWRELGARAHPVRHGRCSVAAGWPAAGRRPARRLPPGAARSPPAASRSRQGGRGAALGGARTRRRRCVPEAALARRGTTCGRPHAERWPRRPMTLAEDLLARVEARVRLRRAGLATGCRCWTPIPPGAVRVARRPCRPSTTRPPWPARSSGSGPGSFEKIVLAREVRGPRARRRTTRRRSSASCAHALPGLLRRLRGRAATPPSSPPRPSCCVRREGMRASTVALAGSTRRSADPAVDDHLGEQLMRSDKDRERAEHRRAPHRARAAPPSVWMTAPPEPEIVRRWRTSSTWRRRSARSWHQPRRRDRARGHAAPDTGGGRRAVRRGRTPQIPACEGLGPRLGYAGPGRLDGHERGRRVLRRPAQRAAGRRARPAVRGRRAWWATPSRPPS